MEDEIPADEIKIYLTQVKYLEEELDRCQQHYNGLEARNVALIAEYEALEKHKTEAIDHLKRLAAAKARKQGEQLQAEQLQHSLRLQGVQQQHDLSMQQLQQRHDELLAESSTLETACLQQQQLQVQQAKQIQKRLDFETRMTRLVENIKELEVSLERQKIQAKTDKENEIAARKARIERQVAYILQKDRVEDAECMERLVFLQKKNVVLPGQIDVLQKQNTELTLRRDQLKAETKKHVKEGFACREEVKKTRMECQQMKAELEIRRSTLRNVQSETEALRGVVATVSDESRLETIKVARLKAEIQSERQSRRVMETVQWEGGLVLTHILRCQQEEEATETEKKLQRLLEILESSAH